MLVIIASTNPVKTEAARGAFRRMFPDDSITIRSVSVPSAVADQPKSDLETLQGARNRAEEVQRLYPDANYWVGIEGGIDIDNQDVTAFAWAIVRSPNLEGKSRTSTFNLPPAVCRLIEQGKTLSEADDIIFAKQRSGTSDGAIGLFTGGAISRTSYHEQAVMLALIPHKNSKLYID